MKRLLFFLLCLSFLILPARASEEKYVALTFDDGPSGRYTKLLLDGLQERNVKATFLLCGYRMAEFPELTQRIFSEGHEIGYHGYSHDNMKEMSRRMAESSPVSPGEPAYITVFGAGNMDIGGTPDAPLVRGDSNPGTVRTGPGGVGRNIAHNLCLLGNRVKLVSAFGDDEYGRRLMDSCSNLGMDPHESLIVQGEYTSTYLYITREDGDTELAVNDMRIYRRMTP